MSQHTLKLTVELPEPIFRWLADMAKLTQQSPEALAVQSITGNLPPTVENAPPEIQSELLTMQTLSIDELLKIAYSQLPSDHQKRHLAMLGKNQTTALTSKERQELSDLRLVADQLMIRKAYAWAVLRWRGQRVPPLEELPLE